MSIWRHSLARVVQAVLHNKGAKLIALLLAVIAWYGIQAAISYETVISDIPLAVQAPEGWAVMDLAPKSVDVVFKGARDEIRYLNRDQIKVVLDLRARAPRESMTLPLQPENVTAPGGAFPIYFRPSEVRLQLDQQMNAQLPVKVDFQGAVPDGFDLDKVVCTPATVTLSGPRQRLKPLEAVRTTPVDLEGRIRSFAKQRVPLLQPGENWVARMEPDAVMVDVAIVERSAGATLEDLPVGVLLRPGMRRVAEVWPNKVNVQLRGRSELLKKIDPDNLRAYVDATELEKAAQYDLPVRVAPPAGVTAAGVEPPTVQVHLE